MFWIYFIWSLIGLWICFIWSLIGLWIYFIYQVDRQQVRIRGLIEEQDSKIDEERSLVERRAQEQLRQVREDAESQAGVNL